MVCLDVHCKEDDEDLHLQHLAVITNLHGVCALLSPTKKAMIVRHLG